MPRQKFDSPDRLSEKIKVARKDLLRISQAQFANRLGVSQSNVARWELGKLRPEMQYLMKIAKLVGNDPSSFYFMEAAGVPSSFLMGDPRYAEGAIPSEFWSAPAAETPREIYQVPLFRDSAAAGSPRAIEDGEIEGFLPFLKEWSSPGASLVAVRVTGDSMSPVLEEGFFVILDTSRRDPKKLVNSMVASKDHDGVTIKWLRKDVGLFLLVPQNVSKRHPVRQLSTEEGFGIVGEVVRWIGQPK